MTGASRLDQTLQGLAPPRVGPFKEDAFPSPLQRSPRIASILGIALLVSFGVCFVTGFLSHLIQYPPAWFGWPARPAGLYRVTQGVHVATGIASIPLLLAKLWSVYPRFWTFPPLRSIAHGLERVSLLPLVGGSLFLLFTGLGSIARWFPWEFSFPPAHYAAAWITLGGLVIHVGVKLGAVRTSLSSRSEELAPEARAEDAAWGLSRRGFLGATFAASVTLVATTVGQTFRPLAPLGILAPRDPRSGPQGMPVNKTAASAGVTEAAADPAYRLVIDGAVSAPLSLSLDDLRAMPMRTASLPIACVDGWSATGTWRGVPLADLLAVAGAATGASARVESMQREGAPYRAADVSSAHLADLDTMLALELNGEPLVLDHGFPARLIGPNRPGVMNTKWVARVVVL